MHRYEQPTNHISHRSGCSHQPYTPLSLSLPCPCSRSIAPASLPNPRSLCELSRSHRKAFQTRGYSRLHVWFVAGATPDLMQLSVFVTLSLLVADGCDRREGLADAKVYSTQLPRATAISPTACCILKNSVATITLKPRAVCALSLTPSFVVFHLGVYLYRSAKLSPPKPDFFLSPCPGWCVRT